MFLEEERFPKGVAGPSLLLMKLRALPADLVLWQIIDSRAATSSTCMLPQLIPNFSRKSKRPLEDRRPATGRWIPLRAARKQQACRGRTAAVVK